MVLAGVLLVEPGASWSQAVGHLSATFMGYVTTAACFRAARRGDDAARAWTFMAAAAGTWSVGATIWAFQYFAYQSPHPFSTAADIGLLGYALPIGIALLLFPRRSVQRVSGIRALLDSVVVASATLFLTWSFLLGPLFRAGVPDLARQVAAAYSFVDVVVAALAISLGIRADSRFRRQWVLLGGGVLALATTNSVFVLLTLRGMAELNGTVLAVGWVTAWLLIALSTCVPTGKSSARADRHFTVTQELLPYVPVLGAIVLLAARYLYILSDTVHTIIGVALIAALVLQQTVIAMEKVALANDLEAVIEARTRDLEQLLRRDELILDSAGDGIYGVDAEGRIIFANPATCSMLGFDVAELLGQDSHALFHVPRDGAASHTAESCTVVAALRKGTAQRDAEHSFVRRDGSVFAVEKLASPIVEEGRVVGAVVTFRDITHQREADRMKDEFTSIVSHELRTPLTSIRGSLGLLASGALGAVPEKGQRMLDIAVSNTDRLIRLINDILDMERIASGTIVMDRQRTSVPDLAAQARDAMEGMAAAAGVTLEALAAEGDVWADPDRIMQTLTNLLSNAIKFSEPGRVVQLAAQQRGREVLFSVTDQGRGIPADHLEAIFERFQQVDSSDAREKGGTGLGLPICRSIVEQHGGKIWVESTSGVGSTFHFTLPSSAASPSPADPEKAPAVLVCDDDASVREIVSAVLERRGYRAVVAASGEEALQLAALEQPVAILLDLLMPGLSGWETAERLKAHPETEHIPVVISSVLSPADATLSAAVDVAGWVDKPMDEESLVRALESALARPLRISRVLVVEDDPDLAGVLTTMFEQHGLETFHAGTGREALRLAQRVLPDLLVLDLMLPDSDGFAVVEWLRRHEGLNTLPLVVYTARDLEEAQRERLRLGETRFFTKGRVSHAAFEERVMGLIAQLATERESSVVR